MRLGIRQGTMYKLLGQPMIGSKRILDRGSILEIECSGHEDLFKSVYTKSWYEMRLMDAQEPVELPRSMMEVLLDHSPT